jgi:hypothetical protein
MGHRYTRGKPGNGTSPFQKKKKKKKPKNQKKKKTQGSNEPVINS